MAGAKKVGYREIHTGNMAMNSGPREAAAFACKSATASKAVSLMPNGQHWWPNFRAAMKPAIWKCATNARYIADQTSKISI
jgi:hypothetical protein